jgi:uncharacterized RDD family membrane protein YckC
MNTDGPSLSPYDEPPTARVDDPTNVRGSRIGAALLDVLVLLVPYVVIAFLFLEKRDDITSCDQITASLKTCVGSGDNFYVATDGRVLAWQVLNVLLGVAYFVFFQGRTGWTVGKRAVGVRVVDGDGGVCGLKRAFIRYLPFLVPALIPVVGALIALVEFILILAHPRHQRMGDIFAKTFVVRQEAVGRRVP